MKIIQGEKVKDGAGVSLNRVIGGKGLNHANPFLMLDEFRSDDRKDYAAGFPMHPHRGMETITYMVKGSFTHRDSRGNEGNLNAGEVQWMTAGRGILHEEMPAMEDGELWGYQLWVNLPKELKMTEPRYSHLKVEDIPVIEEEGLSLKLISGEYSQQQGPAKPYYPVDYMDVRFNGGTFKRELKGVNLVYVHSGEVTIKTKNHGVDVNAGDLCLLEDEGIVNIYGKDAGILFISGEKLHEPVAKYGPIVMNTMEEVMQAIDDLNNGNFEK